MKIPGGSLGSSSKASILGICSFAFEEGWRSCPYTYHAIAEAEVVAMHYRSEVDSYGKGNIWHVGLD